MSFFGDMVLKLYCERIKGTDYFKTAYAGIDYTSGYSSAADKILQEVTPLGTITINVGSNLHC